MTPAHRLGGLSCALLALALTACTPQSDGSGAKPSGGKQRELRAHLVETAVVSTERLGLTTVHTGSLRARRIVRIFNQEEGRVTTVPFFESDAVSKDEIVLGLDDALLRAELDKAVATRRQAEADLQRLRALQRNQMVSEEALSRAATAVEVAKAEESLLRTRVGYATVRAPFDAVVSARLVEPGDVVPRHTHVLTLTDPSSLVTDLAVSELLLPHLSVGDPVQVRIDALGARQFDGRILRIHPELDRRTRQGRVEVELTPVPDDARAGQFARVTFTATDLARRTMPFAALRRDREGEYVLRVDAEQKVDRVAVRSGQRLADLVEVLEGLDDGDTVVTKGFLGLTPGTQVKAVKVNRGETTAAR